MLPNRTARCILVLSSVAVAATLVAGLSGCRGREKYVYRSTPDMPQTVSLIDTTKHETVWTYEIPVGQSLKIEFVERASNADGAGYDTMEWTVAATGRESSGIKNNMRVPPPSGRKLRLDLRDSGESWKSTAPVATTAPVPAAAPVAASPAASTPAKPAPAPATPAPTPASKPSSDKPAVVLPDAKQPAPK